MGIIWHLYVLLLLSNEKKTLFLVFSEEVSLMHKMAQYYGTKNMILFKIQLIVQNKNVSFP